MLYTSGGSASSGKIFNTHQETLKQVQGDASLLHKVKKVQGSDTTGDAAYSVAGYPNISIAFL